MHVGAHPKIPVLLFYKCAGMLVIPGIPQSSIRFVS